MHRYTYLYRCHKIQDAKGDFYGTSAHVQIIVVDADLALRRGDV